MAAFPGPEKRKAKKSKILQRQQIKGESAELCDATTARVLTVQCAQALLLLMWMTGIPYHRKETVQIRKNCAPARAEEQQQSRKQRGELCSSPPPQQLPFPWVFQGMLRGFVGGYANQAHGRLPFTYLPFLQLCCQSYHLIFSITPPFFAPGGWFEGPSSQNG